MARIENHNARAWRARAAECRAIADTFDNLETRAKMHLVADDYDRMAEHAERREQEGTVEVAAVDEARLVPSQRPAASD